MEMLERPRNDKAGQELDAQPRDNARWGATHPNVCLLDDDPAVLKATTRLLKAAGLTAAAFTDPGAFLEHANRYRTRVALIDIWMPQMNGLAVQKQLKAISPSTRVIILTSKDDPMIRARAMNAGVYAFFPKGVPAEELLAAINSGISAGGPTSDTQPWS